MSIFRRVRQDVEPAGDDWALFSSQDIPAKDGSGDIYLHRFRIVKTPLFGVYVHDLNLPDTDRDPHDHPWTFWSFVLRGGYTETVFEQVPTIASERWKRSTVAGANTTYQRRWNRWSWHKMTTDVAHKIDTVEPKTKTLVITGRRRRSWGFWTREGFEHWKPYVRHYYATGGGM